VGAPPPPPPLSDASGSMESGNNTTGALPSPPMLLLIVGAVCWLSLYCYRLYWHPLASFPGPRLAAISSWYEAYYEIALQGQYSRQISKLHDEYGMWLGTVAR